MRSTHAAPLCSEAGRVFLRFSYQVSGIGCQGVGVSV